MKLIEALSTYTPVSEEVGAFLNQNLMVRKYRKKAILLDVGQVCGNIYFVENGLVRTFFVSTKGEDTTTLLAESGDFIHY